jgi:hypothetical protein
MNDDGKIAAVARRERHLPHHQWHEAPQAREPPMNNPCPGLFVEGDDPNVGNDTEPPLLIRKNHTLVSTKP